MSKHPHALVHPFRITLVAFIEDLTSLEESGLEQHQCDAVLACLDSVIAHLRTAPQTSAWLPQLLAPFSNLRTEYFHWNNPRPEVYPPFHRFEQCKKIRRQKDGILPRYKFGPLLATEIERGIFLEVYSEFIRLETIKSLARDTRSPDTVFRKTVERAKEKQHAMRDSA